MPTARGELVDVLTPISKGWGTDLGVELTSLAVQVHGGMGYVEETGVAQHYRDIRIAPIYEGTNGIQAIDLVGRKLGLRGGAVIADFLARIDATAEEATRPAASWPSSASGWGRPTPCSDRRPSGCIEHGAAEPNSALPEQHRTCGWPESSPAGGCSRSRRSPLRASRPAGTVGFSDEFLEQKVVTARFYATQLLPQAAGLLPAITAGDRDLFAATF